MQSSATSFAVRSARMVLASGLASLLTWLVPPSARAWDYHEHFEIGRESYRCACAWLWAESDPTRALPHVLAECPLATNQSSKYLQDEKALETTAKSLVDDLVCAPEAVDAYIERYGQATALAGDHLAGPADFESLEGQRDTVSFVTYALRAVEDADHFHPIAPLKWRDEHLNALDLAETANRHLRARSVGTIAVDSEAHRDLFHVLYLNAFGDHFIQDSFVAGHMAMNRAATRPTAAQNYHDRINYKGRVVRDGAGHIWRTHGDGKLHWPHSGKSEVLRASALSVYDTLRAFVTGRRSAAISLHVAELLPVEYCEGEGCDEVERSARSSGTQGADQPLLRSAPNTRWVGLMLAHTSAKVTGAPGIEYRHAIGERGFLRNQLSAVTSFPIGSSFAFRLDLAFGVITPALRPSEATSLYLRAGPVIPLHASYGSALTFDLALGLFDETCVDACRQAAKKFGASEKGSVGIYLGPHMNFEVGRILMLQAFVEPFYAADYAGRWFAGLGFGVMLSKGTKVIAPTLFPGPPL
jgi:hypothetical protein